MNQNFRYQGLQNKKAKRSNFKFKPEKLCDEQKNCSFAFQFLHLNVSSHKLNLICLLIYLITWLLSYSTHDVMLPL